ncbi:MAG: bifunctional phosphopantothenoylcysteine decarboxylase/phosphopantothenate--cysteine ligase CoaBC, partial [Gammaproteobacteria bacterium]|nr:bifunctional phosphopantothenoylcysteine decarboxylase/phosphopantothenate--cysteine ligase CoaBC [Gammaproteobacteria bacterium]
MNILLGVTGGIAAYKSVELVRQLRDEGHDVRVVMTQHAQAFVTPFCFQAISGNPVYAELMDESIGNGMRHIELARWAEIILIAPASANTIAKIAHGLADDLLTTLCLASNAKLCIVPAMNKQMWENKTLQENIKKITANNVILIGPESGEQACGDVGVGRMSEPNHIVDELKLLFSENPFWKNRKV